MWRWRCPLGATLFVATLALACSRSTPSAAVPAARPATPRAAPSTDAWATLLAAHGARGEVTPQLALEAFALLYGPVPGVRTAPGDGAAPFCGTAVAQWALSLRDRFTPEQRAAVERALAGPTRAASLAPNAPSSLSLLAALRPPGGFERVTPGSPTAAEQQRLRGQLAWCDGEIGRRLGRPAGHRPIEPEFRDTRYIGGNFGGFAAWAETVLQWPPGQENTLRPAHAPACTVRIARRGLEPEVTEAELRSALCHEVFHCYQQELFDGTVSEYNGLARASTWVIEGLAAWAGESLAQGSPIDLARNWWSFYLRGGAVYSGDPSRPTRLYTDGAWSLYASSYDAVGWWTFLESRGVSPWSVTRAVLGRGLDQGARMSAALAGHEAVLTEWASTTALRPTLGHGWDLSGPMVPRGLHEREALMGRPLRNDAEVRHTAPPGSNLVVDQPFDGAEVVEASLHGFGRMSFGVGHEFVWDHETTLRLCRRAGGCLCANGRPPPGAPTVDAPTSGTLLMALSGGPGREGLTTPTDPGVSDALLRGRTVESICQPADPRCAGVAQCLRGTWTLDNAHALEQIRRRGAQVTNLRGRLTLAIDDACGAVSTATRFCLENDAGGARFRAVVDGTITGTLSAADGVARGSEARNDLQITSEVQVGGRWLRTPVPLGASRSALGGLGGLPSSVRYTCTETLLTLQNPDGSSAIYRR